MKEDKINLEKTDKQETTRRKYEKPATKMHDAMNVVQGSFWGASLYYLSLYKPGLYYTYRY